MNYGNFIPELSPKKDSNLADLPVAVNYKRRWGNPEYFCGILFTHVRNHHSIRMEICHIFWGNFELIIHYLEYMYTFSFSAFLRPKVFEYDLLNVWKSGSEWKGWIWKDGFPISECTLPKPKLQIHKYTKNTTTGSKYIKYTLPAKV